MITLYLTVAYIKILGVGVIIKQKSYRRRQHTGVQELEILTKSKSSVVKYSSVA